MCRFVYIGVTATEPDQVGARAREIGELVRVPSSNPIPGNVEKFFRELVLDENCMPLGPFGYCSILAQYIRSVVYNDRDDMRIVAG